VISSCFLRKNQLNQGLSGINSAIAAGRTPGFCVSEAKMLVNFWYYYTETKTYQKDEGGGI